VTGEPSAEGRAPAGVVHAAAAVTGTHEKSVPLTGPFLSPQQITPSAAEGAPVNATPLLIIPLAAEGAQLDQVMLKSVAVGEISFPLD
jgi:hypothetical protein